MNSKQSLSDFISKSRKLGGKKFGKKIKIGILSSFTINGLSEVLQVKCAEKNIECITYVGGYNQYNQEILNNKSNFYKFSPNITFLILDTRSLLGEFFYNPYSLSASERKDFVNDKVKEILNLVDTFCKNTESKLVLTNFALPVYSPYGIAESKTDYGFHDMIVDLNSKLKESLKEFNSVYLFDFLLFVLKYGEKHVFNFQNFFFGDIKISLDFIPNFATELMSYVIGVLGISKKCIVLDLDNTLWGGIIGEDGLEGIQLGPQPPGNSYMEFQKILKSLSARGIILAINSKNNLEDALNVISKHPHMILREKDFACMKINWNDKVQNMKEIAFELNIGDDSMVFFDDDPVNREYMRMNLPDVYTPDLPSDSSQYAEILQSINEFSVLKITKEDTHRSQMYLQQRKRKELEKTSTNLDEFLKTLNLHVTIQKSNNFNIPRISQLTLKTNQFNLTTKRYQEEDIRKFSNDSKMLVGCAQIEDKFGDNGITGVFVVEKNNPDEWILDTFLLSCRVMGREVEKSILNYVISEARKNNVARIKAQYIPTKKNKPIEEFLPSCGFVKKEDHWIYNLDKPFNVPEFIRVDIR